MKSEANGRMDNFRFNPHERALYGPNCVQVELRTQTADVFYLLLQNSGSVVTKDQLRTEIWGMLSVTDDSLIQCISEIRKALGTKNRHLIATVRGCGYRLSKGVGHDGKPIIDMSEQRISPANANELVVQTKTTESASSHAVDGDLVGREQELTLILQTWDKARSGKAQVVCVVGQAGIGKTAITKCISRQVTRQSSTTKIQKLSLNCTQSHMNTSWWPLIQFLLKLTKYNGADDSHQNFERLFDLVAAHTSDSKRSVTALGHLLGLSDEVEARFGIRDFNKLELRNQIKISIQELILGLTDTNPVLLVIEDLHWVDPSTMEFIESLLGGLRNQKLMVIINSRPGQGVEFNGHPVVVNVGLNPLADSQVSLIAQGMDVQSKLGEQAIADIVQRAAGIPLYVEELTKSLLSVDTASVDESVSSFDIGSALLARVERRTSVKSVMQIGACVGRSFSYQWISSLSKLDRKKLQQSLELLVQSGLVYQTDCPPNSQYTFKHELIRQAALSSLSERKRSKYFKKTFKLSESKIETPNAVRADYAFDAGHTVKACRLWEECGDSSVDQSALKEGRNFYSRAIDAIKRSHAENRLSLELDLQVKLCQACLIGLGFSDRHTMDTFARAYELLVEVGDESNRHRFNVLWGQWLGLNVSGQLESALERALDLRSAAISNKDDFSIFLAQRTVAITSFLSGDFREANECFTRAFKYHKPEFDIRINSEFGSDILVSSKLNWAHLMLCMGDSRSAFTMVQGIEKSIYITNNKHQLGYTLARLSILHQIGKTRDCESIARKAIDLGRTHNLTMTSGFAHSALGAWLLNEGRVKEAVESFESGLSFFEQSNTGVFYAYYKCHYAICLAKCGKLPEAKREIESANSLIRGGADGWAYADVIRMVIEFEYYFLNKKSRIIARLESAYNAASAQSALLWTLRLSCSLARIHKQQGNAMRGLGFLERELQKHTETGSNTVDYGEAVEFCKALTEVV